MQFAIWDTETTGLPLHKKAPLNKQPKIIEFAGILTDGKTVQRELTFLCNPRQPLEEVITKITGLTDDDLKDEKPFMHYVFDLRAFFEDAGAAVAHNLAFDRGMLEFELARDGKTLEYVSFPKIQICTVEETFPFHGKRMKLEELHRIHVGDHVQQHRALDDVYMLFEVCKKIELFEVFG